MKKKKKKIRIGLILLVGLLTVIGIIGISFTVIRAAGQKSLRKSQEDIMPLLEQQEIEERVVKSEGEEWQAGWIKFEDQIYSYNEDIMTFLFMGIDKDKNVVEVAEGTDGGQADALFLLVMNPKDETLKVISINRNTMTDVHLYDGDGNYLSTIDAQIAVQHGFGNGVEQSCEYQVEAVRKLFYQIPIHGYCAVNMDAVIEITDLIGGVELTALEDVYSAIQDETLGDDVVAQGETVLLDGRAAYSYVRYRNTNVMGSADLRLARQQQFLGAFMRKAIDAIKKDVTLPVELYNTILNQMVTDVDANEVAYLASTAVKYSFDMNHFYSLKGETIQGEEFEEFYIDEEALYELIIDIFYEPVLQ